MALFDKILSFFKKPQEFLRDHHIEYHSLAKIIRINDDDSLVVE